MIGNENRIQKLEALHLSAEALEKKCKRRWEGHIQISADKIKKQLLLENRFQKAMLEMHTTTDRCRQSYLFWILHHMFSLFDYETGLQAINDNTAYKSWLAANQ